MAIKITSNMSLPEKLRAAADNAENLSNSPSSDVSIWLMRDAANVIDALNGTINELEDENERLSNRQAKMGEGQK